MSRLLAFGCSYTYGEGLADCYDLVNKRAGQRPSQIGWVKIVANSFNLECVNLGKSGASNKEICNTVLNTKLQPDDTVIILWTLKERSCIISQDNITALGMNPGWGTRKENKLFQMFYACKSEYDLLFDSAVYIDLANYYLKDKVANVYNFSVMSDFEVLDFNWMQTKFDAVAKELRGPVDLGLDGSHPGPQANQLFAQRVKSHFRKDMKK